MEIIVVVVKLMFIINYVRFNPKFCQSIFAFICNRWVRSLRAPVASLLKREARKATASFLLTTKESSNNYDNELKPQLALAKLGHDQSSWHHPRRTPTGSRLWTTTTSPGKIWTECSTAYLSWVKISCSPFLKFHLLWVQLQMMIAIS